MIGQQQLMSSARTGTGRDDWQTPGWILDLVRKVGAIVLDPCTCPDNPVGAAFFHDTRDNGLLQRWGEVGLVYMNPPYSQLKRWAEKAAQEAAAGTEIVSLVAARTETRPFRRLCWDTAQAACFLYKRVVFVGADSGAPFPSAVIYHGPQRLKFAHTFEHVGRVVLL